MKHYFGSLRRNIEFYTTLFNAMSKKAKSFTYHQAKYTTSKYVKDFYADIEEGKLVLSSNGLIQKTSCI